MLREDGRSRKSLAQAPDLLQAPVLLGIEVEDFEPGMGFRIELTMRSWIVAADSDKTVIKELHKGIMDLMVGHGKMGCNSCRV